VSLLQEPRARDDPDQLGGRPALSPGPAGFRRISQEGQGDKVKGVKVTDEAITAFLAVSEAVITLYSVSTVAPLLINLSIAPIDDR
jgi:hypothetical protein